MKVLIVDDDAIVIQCCRRVLEIEGLTATFASTVKMGEEMLETENFDLLLTDIKMPGQDGFEMITRAKKIRPQLPILAMTGYLVPEVIDRCHSLGVTHFIAKPFTPGELVEAIREVE